MSTHDRPRDFVGHGEAPPSEPWPGGARLALSIVINYEEGAERSPLDGDPQVDAANETPHPLPPPGERDFSQESVYEYGSRVGVWRIMRLLDDHGMVATVFACGLALQRNPAAGRAFAARGYDVCGHGYRWVPPAGLSEEAERAEIRKCLAAIRETTGHAPRGWFDRTPQTASTRRLLAEEGLLFDCGAVNDDIPYFEDVAGRPFLIVPYTIDNNDMRFWRGTFATGDDFERYCADAFDALYAESARSPRVMSVGLHPRIIGRPGRILGLQRFLARVRERTDVWVTTRTAIATCWATRHAPAGLWNWP